MCRCGLGPCWLYSGGTDVSDKPKKSYTVRFYPSQAPNEHVNKDIQRSRSCFPTLSVQYGKNNLERIQKMQSRSATLVVRKSGSSMVREVSHSAPSGKLLFLLTAGTRPRHLIVPQGEKTA